MQIQYNGKSKILRRIVELVNRSQNIALRQDSTDKNTLYWTGLDGVEITVNIPSGAVEVDAELSETSTNPVENQAITKELAKKADKSAIPTVGSGVLSVQRNGKSVGTFSANAAKDTAINIPVPEKVSELENDAGYGTYTKPTTGIPKSDLASGVQASLGKADTALQKHQDISGKLDKTGDASNTTVAFSAASARENVKTGEKLSVIVGKIAKWFADLKTVAFTGSYNDLANKPTIPDGSKYLPLAGGTMSGDIDMATNQKDIVVGTHRSSTSGLPTAVAGGTVSEKLSFETGLPERKSLIGSWLDQNSVWHNILSVRHKNGWNNGPNYGFYLRSLLTSEGNLAWNKQTGASEWQGERVLLDSTNYSTYAATKDHSHGLLNKTLCITIPSTTEDAGWSLLNTTYTGHLLKSIRTSANAPDWLFGNYSAGICFGGADTHGVIMCAYDTPKVKIAGGNGTKPKWYFTFQGKSGTIYDFESMPYAKVAATLTDSGWVAMTVEGYAKSGTVKYRTYGKQITITGSVVLKNDIATSYPAPQNIASTTFDFSKIVGCSGVGHSSSGVGAYVAVENYSGDNLVCVYALGSKIAAGSTLIFTITGFID